MSLRSQNSALRINSERRTMFFWWRPKALKGVNHRVLVDLAAQEIIALKKRSGAIVEPGAQWPPVEQAMALFIDSEPQIACRRSSLSRELVMDSLEFIARACGSSRYCKSNCMRHAYFLGLRKKQLTFTSFSCFTPKMMQRTTLSHSSQTTSPDVRDALPRPIASLVPNLPAAATSVVAAILHVLLLITVLTGAGVGFV